MVRRAAATALERRSQGAAFRGLLLQFALRVLLAAFIFFALFLQPPETYRWPYGLVWIGYIAAIAGWGLWALRLSDQAGIEARRSVALLMLFADVASGVDTFGGIRPQLAEHLDLRCAPLRICF